MTVLADAAQLAPAATDTVQSVAELRARGLSDGTINRRCRPDGPWRRLLPGIVLLAPGEPTRRQMQQALVRYLGPEAVITGVDALGAHGLELARPTTVHVLVPPGRRMVSPTFALVERTSRLPDPLVVDGIPYAPATRAALDAARREKDVARLRDLLSLPVYYGLATSAGLRDELDAGSQRGSSAVRTELKAIERECDTYIHGWARTLLRNGPLPPPRWDVTICDRRGKAIGTVDAWWDEVGMGWQFNPPGRAHLGHLALSAAGVVMVRTEPDMLRTDRTRVLRELVRSFHLATRCERPPVQCLDALHGSPPARSKATA
ncbi:hypothetical protein BJF85_16170 [Saccharomonospora sp. CUA-673]|uniref:hypothetical protein n=1 Tax=Saccharomonospora sp. CUA-673 TaxID=1904969 RepID=UPI000961057E|nr:hypothetical protein [Saccharomonospora sp. CUA-673]OLT46585.1 hypothetical protein BJF85_16170 [Saccharomonospora sp. CUA-673]